MIRLLALLTLAVTDGRVRVINNSPCNASVEVYVREQIVRTIRVHAMGVVEQQLALPATEPVRYVVRPTTRNCSWSQYELPETRGVTDASVTLHEQPLLSRVTRRTQ